MEPLLVTVTVAGPCPQPGYCDLEAPAQQCVWENRIGRESHLLRFAKVVASTRPRDTWPQTDHTTGTEKGTYFIAYNATEANHVAVLTSELFPIRNCIRNGTLNFWYFLPEFEEEYEVVLC